MKTVDNLQAVKALNRRERREDAEFAENNSAKNLLWKELATVRHAQVRRTGGEFLETECSGSNCQNLRAYLLRGLHI